MPVKVEDHLPGVYKAAGELSKKGQDRFRALTFASLVLLVVASAVGLIETRTGGWLAAAAFAVALLLTSLWVFRSAERDWYDGRAAAESVKSVSWKFVVGGEPYEAGVPDAEKRYRAALSAVIDELRGLGSPLRAPTSAPTSQVLHDVRALPLDERQAIYGEQRIENQRGWYAGRAEDHRHSARAWQGAMLIAEAVGLVAAVLKATGVVDVDLLSPLAAFAAGAAAWVNAIDYVSTARAYEVASFELEAIGNGVAAVTQETDWATFVADAEQAMSREHTMWLARRKRS